MDYTLRYLNQRFLSYVYHGPGLFDDFNPKLGQGESTKELLQNLLTLRNSGAFPVILMHSLVDTEYRSRAVV